MKEKEENHFDVIVLGSGPGGYPAAIRAAQNGKKTALIEAKELGGTCLNRGCIPSKTLIANAEVLQKVMEAKEFGVVIGEVSFDYTKMAARKDAIVAGIRKSLEGLIRSNGITLFRGFGKFLSPDTIKVQGEDNAVLSAENIIIATGSEPRSIPAFPFDGEKILDSTSLLERTTLPKSLVIIGGGVIGCEFACLHNTFDVDVTLIEMMPRIIPMEAESVSSALARSFQKQGIRIETNAMVKAIKTGQQGVIVELAGDRIIEAEIALVAVGRTMNTTGIGLEDAGVIPDKQGNIRVNEKMETNVRGIYAIGDIASPYWLAHVATHQGLVAANNASGIPAKMHYDAIPSVIYTKPEVATVGMSLEKAIERGFSATVGSFPFQALGKAQATMETEGFAQIVVEKVTGRILGAQVVGYEAGALVAEMAVAIANELTIESITETIHAHPTITEAWLEAALHSQETPLHLPPKRK